MSPNRTIEKDEKNVHVAADGNGHNSNRSGCLNKQKIL